MNGNYHKYTHMPVAYPGMRIGLFGGSFNPPHDGHRLVVRESIKRLNLNQVWVMINRGNPLKNKTELANCDTRLDMSAKILANTPQAIITAFEAEYKLDYTIDTVTLLQKRYPTTTFVMLIGSDNICCFHKWKSWVQLAHSIGIAVYARPGYNYCVLNSPFAYHRQKYKLPDSAATTLTCGWLILHGRQSCLSSTIIRNELI